MSTGAARVLLLGGLGNLVFSFMMGFVLASMRKNGAKTRPQEELKWIMASHEVAMLEGMLLISLSTAISSMSPKVSDDARTAAAWMLVVASVFQDLQGVFNHKHGVNDQMQRKSLGWMFGAVQAVIATPGLMIIAIGCFMN